MKIKYKDKLLVRFIGAFETYFDGEADAVIASNIEGEFSILPEHSNYITILALGKVQVISGNQKVEVIINSGLLHVFQNRVEIFTNI
jgi:F0F1-type ATP synthase epsilon subunit